MLKKCSILSVLFVPLLAVTAQAKLLIEIADTDGQFLTTRPIDAWNFKKSSVVKQKDHKKREAVSAFLKEPVTLKNGSKVTAVRLLWNNSLDLDSEAMVDVFRQAATGSVDSVLRGIIPKAGTYENIENVLIVKLPDLAGS